MISRVKLLPRSQKLLELDEFNLPCSIEEAIRTANEIETDLYQAKQEIVRLEKWVSDLQSDTFVNCVYCGHCYGPNSTTPVSMAHELKAHIEKCPKHPMSELKKENDLLKAQLAGRSDGDSVPSGIAPRVELLLTVTTIDTLLNAGHAGIGDPEFGFLCHQAKQAIGINTMNEALRQSNRIFVKRQDEARKDVWEHKMRLRQLTEILKQIEVAAHTSVKFWRE